jgi:Ca2+-binding RTX toxin-like protein
VTSESWFDPYDLVLYDDDGIALAADDGWGPTGQDGLSFIAPYSGTYYVDASWAQAAAPRGGVELAILEDLDTVPLAIGNGTDRDDDITGTAANDALYGHGGWDLLEGKGGSDLLDGGSGIDTAWYEGKLADYDVAVSGHRLFVTDTVGLDGSDTLVDVERLDFADVALAFDVDGPAGEAYRLYQAAFDRTPDEAGLGYWIAQMDAGASVRNVAASFVNSAEFRTVYGNNPDNATIITGFYEHVLNRAPDAAGMQYWLSILGSRQDSVAGVLASFSESQENYDQLAGVIGDGMAYQPWS